MDDDFTNIIKSNQRNISPHKIQRIPLLIILLVCESIAPMPNTPMNDLSCEFCFDIKSSGTSLF